MACEALAGWRVLGVAEDAVLQGGLGAGKHEEGSRKEGTLPAEM